MTLGRAPGRFFTRLFFVEAHNSRLLLLDPWELNRVRSCEHERDEQERTRRASLATIAPRRGPEHARGARRRAAAEAGRLDDRPDLRDVDLHVSRYGIDHRFYPPQIAARR